MLRLFGLRELEFAGVSVVFSARSPECGGARSCRGVTDGQSIIVMYFDWQATLAHELYHVHLFDSEGNMDPQHRNPMWEYYGLSCDDC